MSKYTLQKDIRKIELNGTEIVNLFSPKDNSKGAVYEVWESRGSQTDYKRKPFLYLLLDNNGKMYVKRITDIVRKRDLLSVWKSNNLVVSITNQKLFNKYFREGR